MPHDQLYPLRESIRVTSAGGTIETVRTEPVLEGWIWLVLSWGARDVENIATGVRPFVESGDQRYFLAQLAASAADQQVGDNIFQVVAQGERFGVQITGTSNADQLVLDLIGMMLPPGVGLTLDLFQALARQAPDT